MPLATPSITLRITKCAQPLAPENSFRVFDARGGTIGRAQGNDWILPDPTNHISSRHAALYCDEGKFRLVDTSSNGVFLNGDDEPLGRLRTAHLNDGDRMGIGDYEIVVTVTQPIRAACSVDQAAAPGARESRAPLAADRIVAAADPLDLLRAGAMPVAASFRDAHEITPTSNVKHNGAHRTGTVGTHAPAEARSFQGLDSGASEARDPLLLLDEAEVPSGLICDDRRPDCVAVPNAAQRDDAPIMSSHFRAPAPVELVPEDWQRHETPALDSLSALSCAASAGATQNIQSAGDTSSSLATNGTGAPKASPPPSQEAALRILLEGAGLDSALADKLDPARTLDLAGRLLREALAGVRELLLARATLKAGFHVPLTLIAPKDNNPLKFSAGGVTEVMETLLLDRGKAYLSAVEAIREGVQDLKSHQLALVAGVRSSLDSLVEFFDPKRMEEVSMRQKAPGPWTNKKAVFWDMYCARFDETTKAAHERFHELFGRPFASAYEDQDRKLTGASAAHAREIRHGVE
ncbi:MAG: type VI secretion system-associated FHA domain protein TagH [Sterolibacteriaceae bacterium]|nr:type VI secretion system-associated FHA domain protein TagH [Candidatus Methylophosphatis haderslevensis]